MYEKLIQSMVAQGLKDVATDPRLSANLFQVLTEEEQSRALKWIQQSVDKTQVVLGFRREVPTSPIISVTPSSEVETDPPIGMVGEDIIDAVTGQRVNLEGSWFEVSYRCLAQSPNADEVTYLVAIMRQTLLRYRPSLMNAGLFEQKISMTDLMPSEDYNDPNIEIFQRGIELSGTAFSGYDAVQSDGYTGIISDIPSATSVGALLTTYASPDTSTITFAASKITDTFVRGDNTTLLRTSSGHLWAPLSGTWGITGNAAYTVTPGADHRSLAVVTAIANGRAAMKMAPGTSLDASAGVSGFSAYRQIPERIGWNLVKNGGFLAPVGSEWSLDAQASVVADSTSVTGYALKTVPTGSLKRSWQDFTIEAGKPYRAVAQVRSDGVNNAYFNVGFLDAAGGNIISYETFTTSASYVELDIGALTAPGNARTLRVQIYNFATTPTFYFTAFRVFQQTSAPATWVAAHQQTVANKGLCIYEAATNLLTNGDIESALSGTVDGFNDPFADLNAWTLALGTKFVSSANIVSRPTAALSGFSAYRQIPERIGWNLVKNGGPIAAVTVSDWTLHANASRIVDGTSPTGFAVRTVATGSFQASTQSVPVEAGKAYSFACQVRTDGVMSAKLQVNWYDAASAFISSDETATTASTTYIEKALTNLTAPGNARTALVILTNQTGSGTCYHSAMRMFQQTTAPAAWTATHQQTIANKGLSIYEAGTNLLTNGDFESALSGTVDGFNDPFNDLNAWSTDSGTTFTVASNVVSTPDSAVHRMTFGHTEWWDIAAGSRIRFKWVTGGSFYWVIHYVDPNNWVYLVSEGSTFALHKSIAGSDTTVNSVSATLTNGNWYWIQPTITGTSYAATLDNDSAGAPGTNVATISAQTISDAAVQTGKMSVTMVGAAGMQFGGAFASVCRVKIAAPPGWSPNSDAGVSAFCVSKTTKFSGTYSLSVYNNHSGANGRWGAAASQSATSYTASSRVKIATGGTAGVGIEPAPPNGTTTGVTDWKVLTTTGTPTGTFFGLRFNAGPGTAWFDLAWYAQQAYDTGNSDLSGQAYATGARTGTSVTAPLPDGFNIADFSRVIVVRPDHAGSVRNGYAFQLYVDANNWIGVALEPGTGKLYLQKDRATNFSTATTAATIGLVAGDTLAIGVTVNASTGLTLLWSVNGAAVQSVNLASAEATTMLVGTPTNYIGQTSGGGGALDGTIGIDRILKAGVSGANVSALMTNPYQAITTDDLSIWRFESGVPGDDGTMTFGHPEWWDLAAGSRIRFKWVTGGTFEYFLRYVDSANKLSIYATGTSFAMGKTVAGVGSTVTSVSATLTNGNWYWFQPTVTGTGFAATLDNDNAGVPGTNVATIASQTVADAALTTGTMGVQMLGAALQFGGAFASVCRVKIAAPSGWNAFQNVGVPAFCVSKTTKFSGTYSLSVYHNHALADSIWFNPISYTINFAYSASCRMKYTNVVTNTGGGARIFTDAVAATSLKTGTRDWAVEAGTATAINTTAGGYKPHLAAASGTVWWDLHWFAQQAYDTGNSDLSGQAYATGVRTATSVTETPLPTGFNVSDFSRVSVVRFDHAYNGHGAADRYLWTLYIDGSNYFSMRVVSGNASLAFLKVRAGIGSFVGDSVATAFAAGDTLVVGMRHSASVGLELQVSKNGGAIATYTLADTESKAVLAGTPLNFVGWTGGGNQLNGTFGIDRILPAGYTAAQVAAVMALAYSVNVVTPRNDWRYDGAQTLDGGGTVGARLAFRFTDKDNGFYVEAQPGQYALLKVAGGVLTTIGTYAKAPKPGDQVMVSLASSSISVFVNGAIALAVTQTFNQTGTLHGIGATDTSLATWTGFTWS